MRTRTLKLLCLAALGASAALPAATEIAPPSAVAVPAVSDLERQLWRSARTWEARGRGDLARTALEKLLRARPDDRRVQLEIGLVELRSNRMDAARQQLEHMERTAPQAPETRELRTAYRVATRDRLRLASIRRLLEIDQPAEALVALQALFPDGPPTTELGIEYWRVVARTPEGWTRAREGFEALVARHPDDPRFTLALAEHLAQRSATRARGLALIAQLHGRDDLRAEALADVVRRAQREPDAPAEAIRELADVRGGRPGDDARTRLRKAEALYAEGRLDSALSTLEPLGEQAQARRLRAEILGTRATHAQARGQAGEALRDLEAAQQLAPEDPWARYRLARQYAALGLPAEARALMDEGARTQPPNDDLRYAHALLLSSLDDDAAALALLDVIAPESRSGGMQALHTRLHIRIAGQEARALHARGEIAAATRRLRGAESAARTPEHARELARAWRELAQPAEALRVLDAALAQTPDDAELALARIETLHASGQGPARDEALSALAARGDLDTALRARIDMLDREWRVQDARALRDRGMHDAALALLDTARARWPQDAALARAQADVLAAAGRWPQARDAHLARVQAAPQDLDARLDLARAHEQLGDAGAARAEIDFVLRHADATDRDTRLAAARRLQSLGDRPRAREVLDALLARAPDDAEVLEQSAWLERGAGRWALALQRFGAAQRLLPDKPVLGRAVAEIEARRQRWMALGLDTQIQPGDRGISDVHTRSLPLELRWAPGYDGHFFALAEAIEMDVGVLPADYDQAARYGSVQAQGPGALAAFPQGHDPTTEGVALGVGYENDRVRVDLGRTPLGMPVEDWVGGLRLDASGGPLDYRVEFSRRAVTSSLVALGGARDPASGRVWGGARENAMSVRAAYYGNPFSATLGAELSRIEGRNILDNDFFGARGNADYRVLDVAGQQVFVGAVLTYWNFEENQRYYTFGHGGYYSPQSYVQASLPVEWRGRWNRWSYRFEATVSRSRSREDAADFYPADAALQAQALASPLPSGFDAPVYGRSTGSSGSGYGLRGAVEYLLASRWVLGTRLAMDRADFYEPDFFTLYLRYRFDGPEAALLAVPPRVPRRYTDF